MEKYDYLIIAFLIINVATFVYYRYSLITKPLLIQAAQTASSAQASAPAATTLQNFLIITIFGLQGFLISLLITLYLSSKKLSADLARYASYATCCLLLMLSLMLVVSSYPVI